MKTSHETAVPAQGYMRIFLDEGQPIGQLLEEGSRQKEWQEPELSSYVDRLQAAF